MITLLCVVGDSEVRAKDTEVGKGTPLTSPFIEGICGPAFEIAVINCPKTLASAIFLNPHKTPTTKPL